MSDGSDSDSTDIEFFRALPDDTYEAIRSEASAIRRIIKEQKELPFRVIKYYYFEMSRRNTTRISHQPWQKAQSIHPVGSKRVRGVSSSKQADDSWALTQPVPGRNAKWPTVGVEVGVSETYRKLKADAWWWWLTNSKGDVKLVIIVSINRQKPKIKKSSVYNIYNQWLKYSQLRLPIVDKLIVMPQAPTPPRIFPHRIHILQHTKQTIWTTTIVGLPIVIYTSWILYERLYLGKSPKSREDQKQKD
ncbi:uncharacterized protein N7518_001118 [Penicillium psychrosexuale]|uniref:uncharacterized protein n=1 Tax=Penicillium psychrosexuale TaxID=1002107 RepID=UPI00254544B3|nr:uncharacterized protein N7518_001118 [Penicillium psychrosexuale]KAJ5804815.1 hypothetical protein N7518_001118 [Penicillium psychrosexuale]